MSTTGKMIYLSWDAGLPPFIGTTLDQSQHHQRHQRSRYVLNYVLTAAPFYSPSQQQGQQHHQKQRPATAAATATTATTPTAATTATAATAATTANSPQPTTTKHSYSFEWWSWYLVLGLACAIISLLTMCLAVSVRKYSWPRLGFASGLACGFMSV